MDKKKKKYETPQMKKVKLFTGDAVLSGCKTSAADGTGKNVKGCSFNGCKGTYAS